MEAQLLGLALDKARELLGDRAEFYEPIMQRIRALRDGDMTEDPAKVAFDFGALQSERREFLQDIEVTQLLMAAINILSLERRLGEAPEKEKRPFMDLLRELYPTRLSLI